MQSVCKVLEVTHHPNRDFLHDCFTENSFVSLVAGFGSLRWLEQLWIHCQRLLRSGWMRRCPQPKIAGVFRFVKTSGCWYHLYNILEAGKTHRTVAANAAWCAAICAKAVMARCSQFVHASLLLVVIPCQLTLTFPILWMSFPWTWCFRDCSFVYAECFGCIYYNFFVLARSCPTKGFSCLAEKGRLKFMILYGLYGFYGWQSIQ